MFNIKAIIVSFLIPLFCSSTKAQDLQFGFRIESNGIKVERGTESLQLDESIWGLQLNASYYLFNKLSIEARASAILFLQYYRGSELGIMAKYYFIKPVYVIGGVISHYNYAESHNTWGVNNVNLTMPALGIGVNVLMPTNSHENSSFRFDIELLYLYAGNKEIGFERDLHNEQIVLPLKINYALKIGAGFSWSL